VKPREGARQSFAGVVLRRLQQLVQTPREPRTPLDAAAVQSVQTSAQVHAKGEHASARTRRITGAFTVTAAARGE